MKGSRCLNMLYQEFDTAFNFLYWCFLKTFIQREETVRHHTDMSFARKRENILKQFLEQVFLN